MMQSAYLRNRDDRTIGSFLPASVLRSIAIQGHVATESVVVVDVAAICCRSARFSRASCRWLARVESRVRSSVEIMRAIVDRIGCKLNVFNEDGVYRRDTDRALTTLS